MLKQSIFLLLFNSTLLLSQDLPRYIDVTGTAEILADADHISFVIMNKNVAETLQESKDGNTTTTDNVIKIFNEFKLLKNDWEISPIRFGKEYLHNRDEREFIGYYSSNRITVKLRNIEDYFLFINSLSLIREIEVVQSEYGLTDILQYHKNATIQAAENDRWADT